jgi:hypothetical protein
VLIEVEWKTIFFFSGLFILVGGIEATGVIAMMAKGVIAMDGRRPVPDGDGDPVGIRHRIRLYRQQSRSSRP